MLAYIWTQPPLNHVVDNHRFVQTDVGRVARHNFPHQDCKAVHVDFFDVHQLRDRSGGMRK
eukprot:scaffold2910_cov390-Prasinococcus_capsulatus_cf.AAC.56